MGERSDCPNPGRWQQFLDGDVPDQEKSKLEQHLESCEPCQKTLDGLVADQASWSDMARNLSNARAELDAAHERAQSGPRDHQAAVTSLEAPEGDSLSFLQPSEKPESLGRLGHYEILEIIGRGGMGIVLRAFDDKLHRVVAIKVMAPQLAATSPPRKRFLREARAAAAVRHEHVVDIHAVEEEPIPYLIMEYVPGENLQQKLDRVGPLEVHEVLRIGEQVARGLAAAHERGLIHRDIKPANILLESGIDQRVKITDFGLARAADDASLTQSGMIAGTPMYMAPEQTEGETSDHRADLFSFGSVLYTMCSGRPPFRASTSLAVLRRVAEDTPRPIREIIPEVPQWLCDIITKLQAKKAADRFQSAKEVGDVLGRCLTELQQQGQVIRVGQAASLPEKPLPNSPSEVPPQVQPGNFSRGKRRWVLAAAVVLLLLGGLSVTEATGVTNLRATVIRVFTGDGTLIVEVNDPGVKVTIEGDGGLVITGAGPHEVRLRPGSYKLQAAKDGKPVRLDQELVTITRGGKQVVRVALAGVGAAEEAAAKAERGAFVVLGGKGIGEKFDTLAEAVQHSSDGDIIEIRGNGPFVTDPIDLGRAALVIRAAPGFRPVIRLSPRGIGTREPMLRNSAPIVLEGIEFQRLGQQASAPGEVAPLILLCEAGSIHVANCRFRLDGKLHQGCIDARSRVCIIRNCEFLSPDPSTSGRVGGNLFQIPTTQVMDNCTHLGATAYFIGYQNPNYLDAEIRVTRNTWVSTRSPIYIFLASPPAEKDQLVKPIRIDAMGNVFDGPAAILVAQASSAFSQRPRQPLAPKVAEALLPRLYNWRDRTNVFALGSCSVKWSVDQPAALPKRPKGVADWKQFWGQPDASVLEGPVRYQGGNLLAKLATAPEKITPEDFRLRPDSAGYRAGKDGKDLGADVDLVGPGKAYERWKKTPAYQQWLKETKQLKAAGLKVESKAFIVLGGKGGAERTFDTLAEAVMASSSGDTLEIRGNGPFITEPIKLGDQALTIRAAEGFRPVLRLCHEGTQMAMALIHTDGALVLEGLELQRLGKKKDESASLPTLVYGHPRSLHFANCRFRLEPEMYGVCIGAHTPVFVARNCEILSQASYNVFGDSPLRRLRVMDNCVQVGGMQILEYKTREEDLEVRLTHCTLITNFQFQLHEMPEEPAATKPVRVEASATIFGHSASMDVVHKQLLPGESEKLLRGRLAWSDRRNLFADNSGFLAWWNPKGLDTPHGVKSLADWKRFWEQPDADVLQGKIRYQGGNLLAKLATAPEKITPEDFRLRPDSAGYRAGKDGKDLGADVDLVGPGPAYERWKKAPAYQQWLKDSGQKK